MRFRGLILPCMMKNSVASTQSIKFLRNSANSRKTCAFTFPMTSDFSTFLPASEGQDDMRPRSAADPYIMEKKTKGNWKKRTKFYQIQTSFMEDCSLFYNLTKKLTKERSP